MLTADEERAAICAWLLSQSKGARTYTAQLAFQDAADAIERGAHHERNGHEGE